MWLEVPVTSDRRLVSACPGGLSREGLQYSLLNSSLELNVDVIPKRSLDSLLGIRQSRSVKSKFQRLIEDSSFLVVPFNSSFKWSVQPLALC